MNWLGWIYSNGIWEAVCRADDIGVCQQRLDRICTERCVNANTHSGLTRGGRPPAWLPRSERHPLPADAPADSCGDDL